MPEQPHKLHVKIGSAEFTGEGDPASVHEQYQQFLSAIQAVSQAAGKPADKNDNELPDEEGWDRFFRRDGDTVSLVALPNTEEREADSLVAILFGFKELADRDSVGAGDLLAAARQSGLQLSRADRVVERYHHLINSGGNRRGKRYSLNNQGIQRARIVLTTLQ